jgi:hypothetical protein
MNRVMRAGILYFILLVLILSGCAFGKKAGLGEYPENPSLFRACTSFYEFILYKDLDFYYIQTGIREFFPDRQSYYSFLDSILPAMWERNFERHRIISYTILYINMKDSGHAIVKVHLTSDDVLPFGKVMTVEHEWLMGSSGWYPGEVRAPKATRWDKLR